jgi:hypothetical protein
MRYEVAVPSGTRMSRAVSANLPAASSEPTPTRADTTGSKASTGSCLTDFRIGAVTGPARRHHPQEGPLRVLIGKERFSENHAWSGMPRHWPTGLASRAVIEVVLDVFPTEPYAAGGPLVAHPHIVATATPPPSPATTSQPPADDWAMPSSVTSIISHPPDSSDGRDTNLLRPATAIPTPNGSPNNVRHRRGWSGCRNGPDVSGSVN